MTFFQEYALLIAVAIPVLAIVGINVYLALTGEVDTLLLPFLRDYPRIDVASGADVTQSADELPIPAVASVTPRIARRERVREAA